MSTCWWTGETGTGKEVVANLLHRWGRRRAKGNFVAVNCGALPEQMFESEMFGYEAGAFTGAQKRRIGKLEHASGGTLFLDEIESMPLALQVKLLRVLQDGVLERLGSNQPIRANCRVIAAVKGDMAEHVAAGTFRRDLMYRLNVVTITLPPLAERREDVGPVLRFFCSMPPCDTSARAIAQRSPASRTDAARLAGQCARTAHFAELGEMRQFAHIARPGMLTEMAVHRGQQAGTGRLEARGAALGEVEEQRQCRRGAPSGGTSIGKR